MWKNLTILSLQHFGHFTNPCNIDLATNTRLLKFLATFFCNIFVPKIAVLATLFNVARKNVNVAKKKPMGGVHSL